jgi:hypothetical protein
MHAPTTAATSNASASGAVPDAVKKCSGTDRLFCAMKTMSRTRKMSATEIAIHAELVRVRSARTG